MFFLVAADVATLLLSTAISLAVKHVFQGVSDWGPYLRMWPFLFVFIAAYALSGLYSGVALSPPQELRRATVTSVLIFLILSAVTVTLRSASRYVTWTLLLAAALSVLLLPILRAVVRSRFARASWWGTPAVIFGAGPRGQMVVRTLLEQPELGLRPAVVVDDDPAMPSSIGGVPVVRGRQLTQSVPESWKVAYAVLAMPGLPDASFLQMIKNYGLPFSRILFMPGLADFGSLWVDTRSVGGLLALEVCHQAFERGRQVPKRILDLALTAAGSVFLLPLLALIALWVRLDSPGPVFYSQYRVGQDGRPFRAWKFRTMVQNAEELLGQYLRNSPELRAEWQRTRKLRTDPRITPIGRFLRRTSLDELPQIWNVLRGEMSLVGPRPIVVEEIAKYGDKFDLYTKVKSGITGMWQISGRNDTSYEERVRLDTFYVRNWSIWLDFYILFRTIETVLFRRGAY